MATTKKKLLLVADTYYPKVDGTLKFIEEFIKRTQTSFEINLLVPHLGDKQQPKGVHSITFVEPSRIFNVSGYPSCKLSLQNIRNIKKAITGADIVFIQGPALISYLSLYYSKKFHKKTFFYTHTLAWELFETFLPPIISNLLYAFIKRVSIRLYNRCTALLVPYDELKWSLQKEGVTTKVITAKLGVDITTFVPSRDKTKSKEKVGIPHSQKVIGYVGRISKEKNTPILLKAFQRLSNQTPLTLLIVGDGPDDQTKSFRQSPNCVVTGFVSNVQDYLKAMDIFVMPSLTETTSLATLEAMATGLPVVASKVGFIKTYLKENDNGFFFPKNNATLLALKLERLLGDEKLCQKIGSNARKTVAYSFSWERSINKIQKILH